jgi:medium-chain acyl-[acyl-carrier-protein] hydrolase
MNSKKLFCIPYSGGSAAIYAKWNSFLKNTIEVVPVELAGRGRRIGERFYDTFNDAVEDIYGFIGNDGCLDSGNYALYGHSMGSLLVYEVMKKIKKEGKSLPDIVFLSGRRPPHIDDTENDIHELPDEKFIDEIRNVGGTPEEFFKSRELLDLFIPIIRADYRITEKHGTERNPVIFESNIVYFHGSEDALVNTEQADEWRRYTNKRFEIHEFRGGHFFIHDKVQDICRIISDKVTSGS